VRSPNSLISRPIAVGALLVAGLASAQPARDTCTDLVYPGFDSRLTAELIGHFAGNEDAQGFEIVNGKPVVALRHQLLAFGTRTVASLPSLEPIRGISVDSQNHLRVQYAREIRLIDHDQWKADTTFSMSILGQLTNSGNVTFLDTTTGNGDVAFAARHADGRWLTVATIHGQLRAASWNKTGLAAVVNDSLLVWPAGSRRLQLLVSDLGLQSAHDVCLIDSRRAVVTLENLVLLVSGKEVLILVALHGRCRWNDDTLYLLDEKRGMIWTVRGLNKLGDDHNDSAYATDLIKTLPKGTKEDDPRVLEAARILGCQKVRALIPRE
jgi:hypothetical protein